LFFFYAKGVYTVEKMDINKVSVLGAGYMGSAITFPLSDKGIAVNLWGTWLDDEIIDICKKGPHPKLKKPLPGTVKLFHSNELEAALADAQYLFIAVSSQGFLPVCTKTLDNLMQGRPFFVLTKGFVDAGGRVKRVSTAGNDLIRSHGYSGISTRGEFKWVSIGGPVKAVELCHKIPSASIYGTEDSVLRDSVKSFQTAYYRISTCNEITGVELSAAFKNVYAIGLGICDGIYASRGQKEYHNLCAILFSRSLEEISIIVENEDGDAMAVWHLAGVGDLYVTGRSGRNRKFGELVGKGQEPIDAYNMMLEDGRLVEGYDTLKLGMQWIQDKGEGLIERLPLLKTLFRIIFHGYDPETELKRFVEGYPYP
jgi:glycerol-3-phosphate dehydrogenase (NAD(P)+)